MNSLVEDVTIVARIGRDLEKMHEPTAAVSGLAVGWPRLGHLGLSAEAKLARLSGIGGSDANVILSNDGERTTRLWREKRGEIAAEDLSEVLPVMMGHWTEAFNRQWYERATGEIVEGVGLVATSADYPWRRATLDGFVSTKSSVWEAKHVNAFARPEEVLARYMPQLQHNMAVMGFENAILSVIYGNHKWECYEVASDWLYQEELLSAEARFWACIRSGELPVAEAPPPAPRPVATRELCLEGNNAWAAAAADWRGSMVAAKTNAAALKTLKELIEDDVVRAYGHGIEAKRSKSGAVTVREYRS
jgi:predicted phage-related endonuclease